MLRGRWAGILLLAGLGSMAVAGAAAPLRGAGSGAGQGLSGAPVLSQHIARATLPVDTVPSMRFAVRNVAVFDGVDVREDLTVLVEGGRISAVGRRVTILCEVPVLDGRGKLLLPAAVRLEEGTDFVRVPQDAPSFPGEAGPDSAAEVGFESDDGEDPAAAPLLAGVRYAHARGLLAVVRTSSLADLERALAAGADGVIHSWTGVPVGRGLAKRMAAAGMFLAPTVEGDGAPAKGGPGPAEAFALEDLPGMGVAVLAWPELARDTADPGAELREVFRILVDLGLDPLDALRASTSLPARFTALGRGGRIEPGARADLVLVDGGTSMDPGALREVVASWVGGVPVESGNLGASAPAAGRAACGP